MRIIYYVEAFVVAVLSLIIYIPFLNKEKVYIIKEDFRAWSIWKKYKYSIFSFFLCFIEYKQFRNVVYYRLGKSSYLLSWLFKGMTNLYIYSPSIGGGFTIQHGFSTIINANKIGCNFKVFQQVTIGYNGSENPSIGDNVTVCCGAKVIGGVHIGNNVTIGANAVVVKDIPDNVIVAGVPAKVIKYLK